LGIPLEPAYRVSDPIEFGFTVMAEWRVPEVVCETGYFDEICIATQCSAELASDLRNFQSVRESRAGKIRLARQHHLRLRRQATQADGVQHTGSITSKCTAHR
jgi:hypothetical protein